MQNTQAARHICRENTAAVYLRISRQCVPAFLTAGFTLTII